MNLFGLIAPLLLLSGCASVEYVKNINPKDMLYETTYNRSQAVGTSMLTASDKESLALTVGADRSNFIAPNRSSDRIAFEKEFPIEIPSDSAREIISSPFYDRRVAQALALGADIDPRTSGFLKDVKGYPISLTGKLTLDTNSSISSGALTGATSGVAQGAMAVSSINNQISSAGLRLSSSGANSVMGANIATGMLGGMIAGAIAAYSAEQAIKGITTEKDFGSRMGHTMIGAGSELFGVITTLGPAAEPRSTPVDVVPGVIKRVYYALDPTKREFNGTLRMAIFSAVGVYRGEKYATRFPYTEGWEYRITNLNQTYIQAAALESPESMYRALKTALTSAKIRL